MRTALKYLIDLLTVKQIIQICTLHRGHGKPGKSWNLRNANSWHGKSLILNTTHQKSWNIRILEIRL